jgi:hypothetical protein
MLVGSSMVSCRSMSFIEDAEIKAHSNSRRGFGEDRSALVRGEDHGYTCLLGG